MRTVLFIPGFHEDLQSRDYKSVIKAIENKDYEVKFVPIQWKRTTIDDWVEEFNREYVKYDPRQTILAGFSYGAMTAFMAAVDRNPAELWLFSLSPYFAEDTSKWSQGWLNEIGKKRTGRFKTLTFNDKAKHVGCRTALFYGDKEVKSNWERSEEAHKRIKGSELAVVHGVGHDVAHPDYIKAIKGAI